MPKSKPSKATTLVEIPNELPHLGWTVQQLRAMAEAIELDLGKTRLKADILAMLLEQIDTLPDPAASILDETNRSITKAFSDKLLDQELHAGPIAALRALARKIDSEDELREYAIEYNREHKLKPPPVDNVSIPTYLKYCESLGLTVATSKAAPKGGTSDGGSGDEESPKSKLKGLRSQYASKGA